MKKGNKYKCSIPGGMSGSGNDIDEGIFEVISLTDKTCKLKQIEKGYFDFVSRFMRTDKAREERTIILKSNGNMKDFIKEDFTKYDTGAGLPFYFELI